MIPDPLLIELLERRTGMTLASVGGERAVSAAIRRCLEKNGFPEPAAWQHAVRHSAEKWDQFVHEVIVPETFFFRYPESFAALADWVKTQSHRHLRILSLPCSTGEEPYSIAMTLSEAGLPPDRFEILAIDIDRPSVERARAAEYLRSSSFRAVIAEHSQRYWDEKPDGRIALTESIRQTVSFQTRNLWDLGSDGEKWDVIFCRNLLIYFSEQKQIEALEKLGVILQPEGLLFLGPAEVPVAGKHGWRTANYPMAFVCRRNAGVVPATPPRPITGSPSRIRPQPAPRSVTIPPPAAIKASPPIPLDQIRQWADQGETDRAEIALKNYLGQLPDDPDALVLAGLLAEISGRKEPAEGFFRKAIYLTPDHGEAIAHLALLLESQGRLTASRKLRERAERLPVR